MSALVKKRPAMGVLRIPATGEELGCNCGTVSIWRARSGDALIKKQSSKLSVLMAILDCVCGAILPVRAATQLTQEQFHCGKPPPAELPRMWMRINPSFAVIAFDQIAPA